MQLQDYFHYDGIQFFDIRELVHPSYYKRFGNAAVRFLDKDTIKALCATRVHISLPFIINNWHVGGNRKNAGLRPFRTTIGTELSMHKLAKAFDPDIKGLSSDEMHAEMLRTGLSLGWTAIESVEYTPTWTHLDTRITGLNELKIIRPV